MYIVQIYRIHAKNDPAEAEKLPHRRESSLEYTKFSNTSDHILEAGSTYRNITAYTLCSDLHTGIRTAGGNQA